jgi:hypothetical protein
MFFKNYIVMYFFSINCIFVSTPGNDVKILPRCRVYVETCTERQNFNILSDCFMFY